MGRDDVPRWCEIAIRRSLRHHPEEVAAHVHAKPDPHASHDDAQVDFALVPGRASVR
jgi:hypothetical protein